MYCPASILIADLFGHVPTDGTKVQVTDLGSTNGTYLDEDELPTNRAADVYVGSRITFGKQCPAV